MANFVPVSVPWSDDEVASLNGYQRAGYMHPFTCANRSEEGHQEHGMGDWGVLVATNDGWICRDCDYTQGWAHDWMTNWLWKGLNPFSSLNFPKDDNDRV